MMQRWIKGSGVVGLLCILAFLVLAGSVGAQGQSFIPLVFKPQANPTGSLGGQVFSAITGQPLAGATICLVSSGICQTTGADGAFSFASVPAGTQTLRASAEGYITLTQDVAVFAGQQTTHNLSLSPQLQSGEMRIVLTWGANPADLDAHLWFPGDSPIHIYFANPGNCETFSACLDVDDTASYGPETITLKQREAGTYSFAVHHFDGSGSLATSGARVQVYGASGLIQEFQVPTSGEGEWWYVFDLEGSSGALTPRNVIRDTQPR